MPSLLVLPLLALPLLGLGCAAPSLLAPAPPDLPPPVLPPDTLLLREWFPVDGPERTLGRRERFDGAGCWTQAVNTQLVVQDPDLAAAPSAPLWFNGTWDEEPWYCLGAEERTRLATALAALPAGPPTTPPRGRGAVVERWTAVVDGRVHGHAWFLGSPDARVAPALAVLWSLSSEGSWARSPEKGLHESPGLITPLVSRGRKPSPDSH